MFDSGLYSQSRAIGNRGHTRHGSLPAGGVTKFQSARSACRYTGVGGTPRIGYTVHHFYTLRVALAYILSLPPALSVAAATPAGPRPEVGARRMLWLELETELRNRPARATRRGNSKILIFLHWLGLRRSRRARGAPLLASITCSRVTCSLTCLMTATGFVNIIRKFSSLRHFIKKMVAFEW